MDEVQKSDSQIRSEEERLKNQCYQVIKPLKKGANMIDGIEKKIADAGQ